jgi:Ca-activated chloride channel homolog
MTGTEGPALRLTHRHGRDPLPAGGPQMVYTVLELSVTGDDAPAAPLNICLLLDQSRSMQGEKMTRVREAARQIAGELRPGDALAVVAFNDRATVVAPAHLDPRAAAIAAAVESIMPRGGTELAAGLRAGLDELRRGREMTGPGVSSLLVVTDGQTYGDEPLCLELAEQARERGILITPLGVGVDWNEDLLETIARRCGSRSEYIDRPAALGPAFRKHVAELHDACGRSARLTIDPGPDARLAGIHRVAPLLGPVEPLPDEGSGRQRFDLGALKAGETQALLLEVVAPPATQGALDLARCLVDWEPLRATTPPRSLEYGIRVAVDLRAAPIEDLDPVVKSAVEKVMAYKLQERAWRDVRNGDLAQATAKLRMVATRLLAAGEGGLARTAQIEADHLEQHGRPSTGGVKQIKYGTRGLGRTHGMPTEEAPR